MRRRCEMLIAASTTPAVCDNNALVRPREVVHQLTAFPVIEDRAYWDLQHDIFAVPAGLVGSFTVSAASGFVFRIKAEMHQGVVALAGFHNYVPATSSIAA